MNEDLVRAYYDKRAAEEWARHDRHRMEFAISTRLLGEHLPLTGRILDCGGGPGRYAIWLAEKGYEVTLFDLSQPCLDWAKGQAVQAAVHLSYEHGTATDLTRFEDDRFDAVLLMGPLYHLREPSERQRAVAEATRVVRPGGLVATAVITRSAALRFVVKNWTHRVLELYEPMLSVISQGFDLRFPPPDADQFHAYFAHPSETDPLLSGAGLQPVATYAVEGFVSMIDETLNTLEGPEWDAWVELNLKLASDPALFLGSEHLLAFGRKVAETSP